MIAFIVMFRWTYGEFFTRYRALMVPKEVNRKDVRGTSGKTLQRLISDPDKYQFGKTKIFFRAGQVAYLEKLRADKLRAACVLMQKTVRGWVQKKKYIRLRSSAIIVQKIVRGFLARRFVYFCFSWVFFFFLIHWKTFGVCVGRREPGNF